MTAQNPIDALLQAERDAEAEIERHRESQHETVSRALDKARVIADRAFRAISNIHTHCTVVVKSECEAMWRSYEEAPKTQIDDLTTAARLERVAATVAEQLTGDAEQPTSKTLSAAGRKPAREADA